MKLTSLTRQLALAFTLTASSISFAHESEDHTRIISAGSTVTELLFALGAKEQVVAVDLTSRHYLKGGSYSNQDKQETKIPVLGYHRQLAAEGLLALSPTHVIGSPDMGPDSTLKLLRSAGVEVTALPTGNSLSDFEKRVDALSSLTDKKAEGEKIKADVASQIDQLQQNTPANKPKVMFVMMSDGRPITVAGNETTVNTVIELAGGHNPVAEHTNSYKPLSVESIVEMQPDYILISERTLSQNKGLEGVLKQHPLLSATPAVKNNKVITISGYAILGGFGLASLDLAQDLNQTFSQVN